ncbi:hypothetical protein EDB84DRAFT_1494228 [Lactarius hengduanensis]|nr:hypothetical protein EDB84DRAFT_1494228 [Lactarius hengduanensis]
MRLGRLEDTVVSLYLLFVFSCLCPRLADVSRSLFCVESVPIQSEAPKSTCNKRVRGFTARFDYIRIRAQQVRTPNAPWDWQSAGSERGCAVLSKGRFSAVWLSV